MSEIEGSNADKLDNYMREIEEFTEGGVDSIARGGEEKDVLDAKMIQIGLESRKPGVGFAELQTLLGSNDLKEVKRDLEETKTDDTYWAKYYVRVAADLKEFDPEWFSENFNISKRWNDFVKAAIDTEGAPLFYLEYLYNLKTLDHNIFESVEIKPEVWDQVYAEILKQKANPESFFLNYAKAIFVKYDTVLKLGSDIKKAWPQIVVALNFSTNKNPMAAEKAAFAQALVPKEGEKVIFTQEDWSSCQEQPRLSLKAYRKNDSLEAMQNFISGVRSLKYVGIEHTPKI